MKSPRIGLVLLLMVAVVMGIAASAMAVQVTSEVRVYVVSDWTLYGRTASGEALSFNPYYVKSNTGAWVPSGPAKIVFPHLESGEVVRVTWTMDVEGRRRVDAIKVVSVLEANSKGVVESVSAASGVLVIRVKDAPGTVQLNTKFVQINGKWVPDPVMVKKLSTLVKGNKITVRWAWDAEGRKRLLALTVGW